MSSVDASQPLSQGKLSFDNKRYSDAVQHFTRALPHAKGSIEDTLVVLDLRCQTYAKLNKHDLALQDAQSMIRVSKRQDPRGYLRCSQIERLTGNHSGAIRWLEHGAKNAPQHHRSFKIQIEKLRILTKDHANQQKRRDPITTVPLEVLELILSSFTYREIVRLLGISRAWRRLILSLPPLTTQIDFTDAKKRISNRSWNAAVKRLRHKPQRLVLAPLSQSVIDTVKMWLFKPTNLEKLEVLHFNGAEVRFDAGRLDKLSNITSIQIGAEQILPLSLVIENILSRRTMHEAIIHNIQTCTFESTPLVEEALQEQLSHLHLCGQLGFQVRFPVTLLAKFPNLENLSICRIEIDTALDLSNHHKLRTFQFRPAAIQTLDLSLPKSLQRLDCLRNSGQAPRSLCRITQPFGLPNLDTVVLDDGWIAAIVDALHSVDPPPPLVTAKLEHVKQDLLISMASQDCNIFGQCRNLTLSSTDMTDKDYDAFSKLFPKLETLEIEAPFMTGVFISDLVKRPHCQLLQITLRNCQRISPDIAQWLTNRNIKCRIINSD